MIHALANKMLCHHDFTPISVNPVTCVRKVSPKAPTTDKIITIGIIVFINTLSSVSSFGFSFS